VGTAFASIPLGQMDETYRGSDFPRNKEIETLLKDAIDPCEQRDYLAHGLWSRFHSLASSVVVCATPSEEESTQREYTADDIYNLAKQFKRLESEIHKVRRLIKVPVADAQILARIDAELERILGISTRTACEKEAHR
jgi:hypothetical protein